MKKFKNRLLSVPLCHSASLLLFVDYTCGGDESLHRAWFSQAASLLDEQRLLLAGSLFLSVHTDATFMRVSVSISGCLHAHSESWWLTTPALTSPWPQRGMCTFHACMCVRVSVHVEILNITLQFPPVWELSELQSNVRFLRAGFAFTEAFPVIWGEITNWN